MKNHQKGSVGLILIAAIVLVAVVGYIYFKQSPIYSNRYGILNDSEKTNKQNTTSSNKVARWKTYIDPQFNFYFQHPKDWSVSNSVLPNSTDVQEILRVKKSNYSLNLYVSKVADTRKEFSPLQLTTIGSVNGKQLVRDTQPHLEDRKYNNYYFVILSQNSAGAYSRDIQNGPYNYSIYYYLPSANFDQSIISEADSIVKTLKFK